MLSHDVRLERLWQMRERYMYECAIECLSLEYYALARCALRPLVGSFCGEFRPAVSSDAGTFFKEDVKRGQVGGPHTHRAAHRRLSCALAGRDDEEHGFRARQRRRRACTAACASWKSMHSSVRILESPPACGPVEARSTALRSVLSDLSARQRAHVRIAASLM